MELDLLPLPYLRLPAIMTKFSELEMATAKLSIAIQKMSRALALMKMSRTNHPYYPLVRVMAKLKLVKDWFEPS